MLVTQSYAQRSTATIDGESFQLQVATEQSRPPVRLYATVRDGLAYARLMKTLYALVCGDQRTAKRDRTAYFEWVQQRYLDELSEQEALTLAQIPGWTNQRNQLRSQIKELNQTIGSLQTVAHAG